MCRPANAVHVVWCWGDALKRVERFMYHILKNQDKKLANKIKHGQPTDSSSDEEEEVVKGEVKEEEVN